MRLDEAPDPALIKCKLPVVGGSYSNPRCHVAAEVLPLIPYSFDVGRGVADVGEPVTGRAADSRVTAPVLCPASSGRMAKGLSRALRLRSGRAPRRRRRVWAISRTRVIGVTPEPPSR